ncbi:MAG: Tetratricopeptide repeat protein [Pelotomaculum sp. PtaB.Bin104]|nr:MAG: Tetratricopeptide repeat protein [Pelotomaculum sp. PtaB.Bin104]
MPKAIARDKKKPVIVKETKENIQFELSHAIAFWGLAILLFLPPYFRGLFFQPEQERALIFVVVVFWFACLWKWTKRDNNFLSHPLDYFVLSLPVVYVISAFQAVNYGLAIDEVVKVTLYFIIYWLVSRLVRNAADIVALLHVIYISAVGVALAGLGTATGVIHINDGFLNERIYSTFQYPNALASYLAAATFIGIYLWGRSGSTKNGDTFAGPDVKENSTWLNLNNFKQFIYAAGSFFIFAVFLGTRSNGGFLVFTITAILLIIGTPKNHRIPVGFYFVLISIPALLAIWMFLSSVAGGHMGLAWLWIFTGLVLALAVQTLYSASERKGLLQWIAAHKNAVLAAALLIVVVGCIGVGVYINSNSEVVKMLAEEIRLRNATERMYFFQDALKMFKERPTTGWGGGGWQEAYRAYQSYLYNSNEVHGHYFQIMVEAGSLGIIVILGIWGVFLYAAHKLYHGDKDNVNRRFLIWTITVAAVAIGLHAAIDFNLSLSALALVMWTMFGLIRGMHIYSTIKVEEKKGKSYVPPNYTGIISASIISIIIILLVSPLIAAGNYSVQGVKNLQTQDISQGVELLEKAAAYNPLKADYQSNLARIYLQQGKTDEALSRAVRAVELSKYSPQRYADLASINYSGKKNYEEAINYTDRAIALASYQSQWYEMQARTCFIIGYNELSSGNAETAKQYLDKATQVEKKIQDQVEGLSDQEKRLWKDAPLLSATSGVKLYMGASQYILGRWNESEVNLEAALEDEKNQGEAAFWLALLYDKQGRTQEAQDLLERANKLAPQLAQSYEALSTLPIIE